MAPSSLAKLVNVIAIGCEEFGSRPYVAFGSKREILAKSRCFLLCLQQQTSLSRVGRSVRCQNRNWPVSSAGFSFLRNLGWLVAPVCLEASGATKPTISAWSFCDYSLIHPAARFADYLLLELEPVVAEAAAAGGGIMFHVSARYFQSAPSCTTTLMYVPVTCWPPTSAAQVPA
jgi:hypothetical protein